MPIKTVVRVALIVSVAGALSITRKADGQLERKSETNGKWSMDTDLPRTVVQTNDAVSSNCGKDIPGYVTIESLLWESSWPAKAYNHTECAQRCDEHKECVGFSARQPNRGRLQCNLYKGLHKQLHRGMSFIRCVKGFECQKGLPGFMFSHAGTWRHGKHITELDDEDIEGCAMACHRNRACVAITYFVGHDEDKFCFHFENENNKDGPRRDMRAYSYAKCSADAPPAVPEDGRRLLLALSSKKDEQGEASGEQATSEDSSNQGDAPASGEQTASEAPPSSDDDSLN